MIEGNSNRQTELKMGKTTRLNNPFYSSNLSNKQNYQASDTNGRSTANAILRSE
jgi:hypothetical protein